MHCLRGGVLIIEKEKQVGPQAAEQNVWLLMTSTLHPLVLPGHFPVSVLKTLECYKNPHGLTDRLKLRIQLHTQTDVVPICRFSAYFFYPCQGWD